MGGRVTSESVLAHALFVQHEARLLPGYEGALGFAVDPVVWTLSLEALFCGADAGDVRDGARSNWLLMALLPFAFAGTILGLAFAPAALRRRSRPRPRAGWEASAKACSSLTAFALPASLAVGWLSWMAIERPARRWARARPAALRVSRSEPD